MAKYWREYRVKLQLRIATLLTEHIPMKTMVQVLQSEGFKAPSMETKIQEKDVRCQIQQIRKKGVPSIGSGTCHTIYTARKPAPQAELRLVPDLPEVPEVVQQILVGDLLAEQKVQMLLGFYGLELKPSTSRAQA